MKKRDFLRTKNLEGICMNKIINEWNLAAESYSEIVNTSRYSNFCKEFISNHFSNISNMKILDAGCGNGEYTQILTKNGGNVTGCDGSAEMIKIAKTKYPSYQFDIVNLLDCMPYGNNEFDMVFCNLVLMDIDPIENTISEFYRIIKNNGLFFFSIVHPAFYLADWEKDEKGLVKSKKVKNYITPCTEKQNFWSVTTHYHRPISYYYNKISEMGFLLKNMFEPKIYEDRKIPDIPLYLFAEFRKDKRII
jgi:ubiquinone/menaquinone biosynthesis C-methylase UbiE